MRLIEISNTDDVIDSRELLARIDELHESRTPYVVGWNPVGCVSDAEVSRYADADGAREALACTLERHAADEESYITGTDEDGRDAANRERAQLLRNAAASLREASGCKTGVEFCATIAGCDYRLTYDSAVTAGLDDDEARELEQLEAFAADLRGYGDFEHGESLIRDSYFVEYAQQLADEIGATNSDASWPNNHIDWSAAADELKTDYTCADFDGVTYWMRA